MRPHSTSSPGAPRARAAGRVTALAATWVALAAAFAPLRETAHAQTPGTPAVTMEPVEYHGWKHNLKLSNGDAELVVTLDVGPRVISYRLAGGPNVFKNYDEMLGKSGEPEWMIRGGHRLWTAPEDTTRTYSPDNGPVAHRASPDGSVTFSTPADAFGIVKEITVRLEPKGSRVRVTHRVTNAGNAPTGLAPWSLSVMAPGGVEVIPLPPHRPHPGSPRNAKGPEDFAPAMQLSLWPFTNLGDPRYHFGPTFLTLRQDARRGATKLGATVRSGGVGYLNQGVLFVKRFGHAEGQPYPDGGVNYETFTNQDMLEMESLGPLTRLAPGASAEHVETWELFGGLGEAKADAEVESKILPKLK